HTKSILCVPLRKPVIESGKEGEVIGVVQLLNKNNEQPFSETDEELLLSFGGSIASSINNAILFHQLEEKYREVELMYSTEHLIASNYNIDSLIEELLSQFFSYLNVKAGGVIFKESGNYRSFWKKTIDKGSPLISQNLLVLPEGMPFILAKPETINFKNNPVYTELIKYYENLGISPEKLLLIPLKSGENYLGNLQLIFMDAGNDIEVEEKVWEILASQIARALELFKMREGLIKNERLSLLGNMMSLIVHDLRSPLNNIIGFADLMTDEDTTDKERNEYQAVINKEVQLMTNMTREILDFAKGKSNILPGKVGVTEICNAFKEKIKFDIESNKVELEMEECIRGKLWVDKDRLLRAFLNIAKNAIEAMVNQNTPKKIKLWVEEIDNIYIFHLKDTGPGIPKEIQGNLFDEYVTSGKEGGTGLRLAIVKKIIEEHGG
ncbi:MAG: GAF domain-containing sensor histidine kinase, partial [Calditrichia bacterium]|nr:GAF domain-containing sensor histidine kinase [Calditrichia bacterium]